MPQDGGRTGTSSSPPPSPPPGTRNRSRTVTLPPSPPPWPRHRAAPLQAAPAAQPPARGPRTPPGEADSAAAVPGAGKNQAVPAAAAGPGRGPFPRELSPVPVAALGKGHARDANTQWGRPVAATDQWDSPGQARGAPVRDTPQPRYRTPPPASAGAERDTETRVSEFYSDGTKVSINDRLKGGGKHQDCPRQRDCPEHVEGTPGTLHSPRGSRGWRWGPDHTHTHTFQGH